MLRRRLDEPLEQLAVSRGRSRSRAGARRTCGRCPRRRPRRRRPDSSIGPARASPSTSEATSSPTRNSKRPGGAIGARTMSIAFSQPAGEEPVRRRSGGPSERAPHRASSRMTGLSSQPVIGELVHARGRRRRQRPLRDDAAGLEVAQPRGQDVRADPGQVLRRGRCSASGRCISSRTTSSAHRSPTRSRAWATGQYWS